MDKPWKVIFAFVGVFIAGAVFGGFFTLRTAVKRENREVEASRLAPHVLAPSVPAPVNAAPTLPGPNAGPQRGMISVALMRRFAQRLNLSGEQREKIRPILGRWGEDFQHLRQENERQQQQYLAESVRLNQRMYGDIAAILGPEHRDELEKMRREDEERVERERQKRLDVNKPANKAASKAVDPTRAMKDKSKNSPGP